MANSVITNRRNLLAARISTANTSFRQVLSSKSKWMNFVRSFCLPKYFSMLLLFRILYRGRIKKPRRVKLVSISLLKDAPAQR